MTDGTAATSDLSLHDPAIAERRHLVSLAFRMLGTVAHAEGAVQETYAPWYRLTEDERSAVVSPRAWLTGASARSG
ncbi:sigma factor [Microbacterium sp. bgisy207]|jgi:RNA polymerase sigma-70 factor (ECF subfamily)|uniref:sigma factor n=1 Tax=Microbacterium sp. bgisy207 TaxID=3413800 RepID=UPI003EB7E275